MVILNGTSSILRIKLVIDGNENPKKPNEKQTEKPNEKKANEKKANESALLI